MHVSERGLSLIRGFESCRLNAYKDTGKVWTIGWGHTRGVTCGQVITQGQADSYLADDVDDIEIALSSAAPKATQNQFDALVSLAFNVGFYSVAHSRLLAKLNAGDISGAAEEFGLGWDTDKAGHVLEDLIQRRATERALFETPDA